MSLTKPLNSKVNMKQYSNADLPVNPKQPAVARYAAESTASQTVINLPFQVDTINAADSFMLMVDGKVLTPGATNDYQFSGVDSFGFSSSVTLNYSLSGGLNIQAIKLGLKKETEFVQDARFTALYEGIDQGLQGFVRTADLMLATTATGTPAAGLFHSTIQNRAAIPDLRTDLKARMGIERIMFKSSFPIQNEIGPNGEKVSGVTNDPFGLIRIVGDTDAPVLNAGQYIRVGVNNALNTGYIEITFYGTGLNLLIKQPGATQTAVYSVDGGAESANFITTISSILEGRNYSPNVIQPVVKDLALGVHTIRIRNTGAAALHLHGAEIVNQASTVNVQPGASYLAGKKLTTIGQSALAYNSSFESGTLGTRGGRVLVYQKADGSIAKAVQPVDAAALTFTATNHQNEEIARVYNFREFGAGRTDDFSTLGTSAGTKAFTLDDGTTTLQSTNAVTDANVGEALTVTVGTTNYSMLTFVGTGLDVELIAQASGFNRSMSFSIDGGASIGTVSYPTSALQKTIVKIASGLPYGTHTVKFSNGSGALNAPGITRFLVYQPKKPTLPTGAVELADYNILGNFANNSTQASEAIASGVLRKAAARELMYVGTYTDGLTVNTGTTGAIAGYRILGATAGNTFRYTFFGTGFDLRLSTPVAVNTFTVAINGTNPTAAGATATGFYGQWSSFVAATGVATSNGTGQFANGLWVSGLPLGLHTVVVTANGAASFGIEGIDLITPIHSYESDLSAVFQNTLPIGSLAISDNRKSTIVKDNALQTKNWSQAIGVSSGPSTTSTVFVPMPDMSATIMSKSGQIRVDFAGTAQLPAANSAFFTVAIDGILDIFDLQHSFNSSNSFVVAFSRKFQVSPGIHKVDVYWRVDGSTVTATGIKRTLTVSED